MLTLAWRREARSGDFFQKMLEPSRKRVRTLDSFFASTRSPSQADALQIDTEDSSLLMENKSKERKWRMKAVKEKLQIFSMLIKATLWNGKCPPKNNLKGQIDP